MPDEKPMGVVDATGKVASEAIGAMRSTPVAIALLLVNCAFLGFVAYILGEVSASSRERDKVQNELITSLVKDIRDCRAPAKP
jgi:hypothetical protein